jgi:hypothetical protein
MRRSPFGISEHTILFFSTISEVIRASLFTVAASAIQIECFSSDDGDDGDASVSNHCARATLSTINDIYRLNAYTRLRWT